MTTVSSVSFTAPPPLPVSALTAAAWASRLRPTHTFSKASEATNFSTVPCTKFVRPVVSGALSRPSALSRTGRSAGATSSSSALTSRCVMTAPVTRFARAACTAGSDASGFIIAT